MEHLWVVLTKEFAGKAAGEKIKLNSEDEKKSLVESGFAQDCDNPESEEIIKVAEESAKKVVDAAVTAIDNRLKHFAESQSKQFGAITVPATAKDKEEEKRGGFKSQGEYWQSIIKAGKGLGIDERLIKLNQKAPQGLNTLDGSEGGFVVLEEISNEIFEMVFADSNLMAATDSETISGNSMTKKAVKDTSRATGSRRGGVRGYWTSEGDSITKSKPAFRELTLKPHKLAVFYFATDEEIEDAIVNLPGKLSQYAAEEINFLVNDAIIDGDGVGKPLGILKSGALVSVAKEGGQAADTIVYPNLTKMYSRMLPGSLGNARWYVNVDTMPQLMSLAFPDASGTVPAFLNGNQFPSIDQAPFGAILGRPIVPIEQAKTLGDQGDIIFADLSMYTMATRGGVRSAMSIHVAFQTDETAFKFTFRVDGQPWLEAPVTPFNGANTLSPFVTLDARA